ncbi:MAG: stage III sporulation protein AE [Firmicutes bacterium]|uniref:Stage III sporulation protein AE n=1 Tax=Candidatus Colimorpha enterica TaxID=3083063 RepID=A0AAE3FFV0_9BACT|nr:stage III sporulation protein AE [Candidatus Colimorpha enterica]
MRRALLVIAVLILLLPLRAGAEGVSDMYGALPDGVKDSLPDRLENDISENGESAVASLGAEYIASLAASALKAAFAYSVKPLAAVIGVLLLSALLNSAGAAAAGGEAVALSSAVSVTVTLFGAITPLFKLTSDTLSGIGLIMKGILPVMTGIYAMSGNITAASVNSTWLMLLLTFLETLTESLLMPLLCTCTGFIAVTTLSRFTGAPDMSGVSGELKKALTFLLAAAGTVFTTVMAHQTALAKSADSVALRSLKFASGNMIPVIGGALGEAADGYLAGVSLIRSASGTLAAAAVISYVLPALLKIAVLRAGLSAVAAGAEIMGRGKEAAVVREAGEVLGIAVALICTASVLSVIAVGVFAGSLPGG